MNTREMQSSDLGAVAALEQELFSTPWSLPSLARSLSSPFALCRVAEKTVDSAPTVVGYVMAQAVMDDLDIQNVAVAASMRRQGIGARLVNEILRIAVQEGCNQAHLEVRAGNEPGLALYRKLGFTEESRRRGYYRDSGEDALVLVRPLHGGV